MDQNLDETLMQIIEMRDPSLMMLGADKRPAQGQLVLTGPQAGPRNLVRHVGYCVQIRLKCGQFGSDMVFLRHADGSLVTHENQFFYALTPEQEELAMPLFAELLATASEEYEGGFRCSNGVHEVGFIIEDSDSIPTHGTSRMTMTTTDADGVTTKTHMTFIS